MRRLLALLFVASVIPSMAQTELRVTVDNFLRRERHDEPVVVPVSKYGDVRSAVVTCDGLEIPSQLDDLDRDGYYDELCFLVDFKGKGSKVYDVRLSSMDEQHLYAPRTYAQILLRNPKVKIKNQHDFFLTEISVPMRLKDPYHLLHHHGVAFENELTAMRIYFDKRQTIDLYGKRNKQLEIERTQFYTDDTQKEQGFGDDVLWVGNTFGLGAFRGWDGTQPVMLDDVDVRTQRIVSTGPLRTIVEAESRGWKVKDGFPRIKTTVRYTLYAGHRDADVDVFFSHDVSALDFSTGVINVKNSSEYNDGKGMRGCWGTDWPTGEKDSVGHKRETVGLAVYVPKEYIRKVCPVTKDNYGFVIGTDTRHLSYRIACASDNETFGFHSSDEWFSFLKEWGRSLDSPLKVRVDRK